MNDLRRHSCTKCLASFCLYRRLIGSIFTSMNRIILSFVFWLSFLPITGHADILNPGTYVCVGMNDGNGVAVQGTNKAFIKITINSDSTALVDKLGDGTLVIKSKVDYIPDINKHLDQVIERLKADSSVGGSGMTKESIEYQLKLNEWLKARKFEDGFLVSYQSGDTGKPVGFYKTYAIYTRYLLFRKDNQLILINADTFGHVTVAATVGYAELLFKRSEP